MLALGPGAAEELTTCSVSRPKDVAFIGVAQAGTSPYLHPGSEGEKEGRGVYPVLSRAQPRSNMDPWFLFPLLWPKLGHVGHTCLKRKLGNVVFVLRGQVSSSVTFENAMNSCG